MAVRATMTSLISHLRQNANASASLETFNGVTYWTDEQLEAVLDSHSRVGSTPMVLASSLTDDTFQLNAPSNVWLENGFTVYKDGTTSVVATSYTFTPENNKIIFDSELSNLYNYNVQGTFYYMSDAIADVWLQKAQHREGYITFKAGGHRMEANQTQEFCKTMYNLWRSRRVKSFKRSSRRFVQQ